MIGLGIEFERVRIVLDSFVKFMPGERRFAGLIAASTAPLSAYFISPLADKGFSTSSRFWDN
jgi:hypothetical protein